MTSYSGKTKISLCKRLGDSWQDLADYFEIPCQQFEQGRECRAIWKWLANRNRLQKLPEALKYIEREDLLEIFQSNANTSNKTDDDSLPSPHCLHSFTKENLGDIYKLRSIFFTKRSYGINETECRVIEHNLIEEIIHDIDVKHFYLIHGNSGRGKSFLVFDLMESILSREYQLYNKVIYYSPHFEIGFSREENVNSILDFIREEKKNKRLLFIIDDCHLANDNFKRELLFQSDTNLCLLLISRDRQEEIVPSKYLDDKLFKNFNKVAEDTFKSIVDKFCQLNRKRIGSTPDKVEHDLKNEIEGSNLVFLTLILQSWGELLDTGENVSISEIMNYTYHRFLNLYDENFSRDWKYINSIVSAFFQYEIRIDKRYLSPNNPKLANIDLDGYIKDRMIAGRAVMEKEENKSSYVNKLFYVFMDFHKDEKHDMMKHAAEFRFYLNAYEKNLTFDNNQDSLERIEFTQLVLKDYLLISPNNPQEVLTRLRENASPEEERIILSELFNDPKVLPIIL
jgi:hypothetical protein